MTQEEIENISNKAKQIVSTNLSEWDKEFIEKASEYNDVISNERVSNDFFKIIKNEVSELIEETIFNRINEQYAEEELLDF